MPKYIITWNAGFGVTAEIMETDSLEDAQKTAYEEWEQEAQASAEYSAKEYSEELADEFGL